MARNGFCPSSVFGVADVALGTHLFCPMRETTVLAVRLQAEAMRSGDNAGEQAQNSV